LAWCKVNLSCDRNDVSIIEEILVANDAISISMCDEIGNNPIYEPKVGETPLWNVIELSALFEETISREVIDLLLEGISYSNLIIRKLENQNWIEKYQENFKPIKFGQKIWVVPSWSEDLRIPESIQLKMDPGMAFGSGSHETTHLCLEYLDENPPKELSVLDYGCGSGILGIASLMLGAAKVIAIDIDPQALIATEENSKVNNVFNKIQIGMPEVFAKVKVDILIANILAKPLKDLKKTFLDLTNDNAQIVMSGIMENQLQSIKNHYLRDVEITEVKEKNGWCLIAGVKKTNLHRQH